MISFGIVKEKVRDTINKICRLFKIPEELSVQILNHVEECSKALVNHVNNEIIDDNIGNLLNNHNDLIFVNIIYLIHLILFIFLLLYYLFFNEFSLNFFKLQQKESNMINNLIGQNPPQN